MADLVSGYLSAFDQDLPGSIERIRTVQILHRPALDVIRGWDSADTLFYCDPPYLPETRASGSREVYGVEMCEQDHRDLAEVLWACEAKGVLSGYPSVLYDVLYRGWRTVSFDLPNNAAGAAVKSRKIERLWLNWPQR